MKNHQPHNFNNNGESPLPFAAIPFVVMAALGLAHLSVWSIEYIGKLSYLMNH